MIKSWGEVHVRSSHHQAGNLVSMLKHVGYVGMSPVPTTISQQYSCIIVTTISVSIFAPYSQLSAEAQLTRMSVDAQTRQIQCHYGFNVCYRGKA